MNGVTMVLRALHHGEKHLAEHLTTVAERHRTEHEIHHVATDLALWSREHVQRLADTGRHYGLTLDESPDVSDPGVLTMLREKAAEAVGRRPEPGLLLLRDLRDLHVGATENSLYWEMLAQAAQATRDDRILTLTAHCHPQTLRQMRWTNTMIKNLGPQILTSL
ncbi:hypothetical protein [Streptomyces flaveolus]|uniref:hypothetical protein n=1 Tax=Streptomyces TaxID=1883 RepID=UPI00166FF992|nr:hypothetical protein [Streptomyces flaveolus]GGQ78293.1 hypothetical protein GCM10010216_45100 [Streptomyces flaveolus]